MMMYARCSGLFLGAAQFWKSGPLLCSGVSTHRTNSSEMHDFDSVPVAPYGSIEPPSARETVSDAQSVPPARHALSRLLATVVLSAAAIVVFTAKPPESARKPVAAKASQRKRRKRR